jgi:mono/diheme cytochrome c family protein
MGRKLAVAGIVVLCACSSEPLEFTLGDLPAGDAVRGAQVYTQPIDRNPACLSCHALNTTRGAGPGMEGYGAAAAQRVDGQSAEQYTFDSILRPSKHMVQGYSNVMPGDYAKKLSQQEIADLIAYSLTL